MMMMTVVLSEREGKRPTVGLALEGSFPMLSCAIITKEGRESSKVKPML